MHTAIVTGILVVSFAVAVPVVLGAFDRRGWLKHQAKRRVIVHTTDDLSFEGTLASNSRDGIVLMAAKMLEGEVGLGGEIFIPGEKIHFVQLPV